MAAFKIGINMAGAVSAGAYTAGVLDFLTEALDEWYKAKRLGEPVPPHEVSIEVISGASAGGMCAAISSLMLQEDFEHISDTCKAGTTNRLYESWVNQIGIQELLKTEDLKSAPPVVSLLDSTIIRDIAEKALTPRTPLAVPRGYVSPNLTLFLSLTNLRGTPYSLNGASPGSIEETTFFFGDRIRFETLRSDKTSRPASSAHPLDATKSGQAGGWDTLQTAAMATGAFPIFLAPRILERRLNEYTPPIWESIKSAVTGTPPPVCPNFPAGTPDPLHTLNVDGGVTNNDPFNYAHDHLATLAPSLPDNRSTVPALEADRAVISIAPFPTTEAFDIKYEPGKNSGIFQVMGRLVSALVSQTRFFGESLNRVMSGTTFDRFLIVPSDYELAKHYTGIALKDQPTALQCATLSAFGGFFHRGFRAHDYALGRRNCQKFLHDSFVLPIDNVVMKASLEELDAAARQLLIEKFKRSAPGAYSNDGTAESLPHAQITSTDIWLPIIPLCTPALREPLVPVTRAKMKKADLDLVVKLVFTRFKAVVSLLISSVPSFLLRLFLRVGQPAIRWLAKGPLRAALIKNLGDSYQP